MKRTLYSIIVSVITLSSLSSQSMTAYLTAAENAFITKDYYSALVYYSNALEFDSSRVDLQYKAGEAARLFDAYTYAAERYEYVLNNDGSSRYPLASYWLGEMKQRQGNYESAKSLFDMYLSEYGEDDEYFSAKARKESAACSWAINVISHPDSSMNIERLGEEINTPYSEFGATSKGDEDLYFSSLRFENKNSGFDPDRLQSKILETNEASIASVVESGINRELLHTAHTAFNTDRTKVYYTVCQYINSSEIRCDLYVSSLGSNGELLEGEKLPELINSPAHTSTQPNVAIDMETGKERLYFVSDRTGGNGKMDVWFVDITDSGYTTPQNLTRVNTTENDITPFYHSESESLYFSSDGYKGLGGYDVFKSQKMDRGFNAPEHMAHPLNTSFHDLYFSLNEDGSLGHFSSNRTGSLYLENSHEACCYDIYKIENEDVLINLNALSFEAMVSSPLDKVNVRLIDVRDNSLVGEVFNGDGNEHFFDLERNKTYMVIASRGGFSSDTINLSTFNISSSRDITKRLFLGRESIELEVLTFDKQTKAPLNGTEIVALDQTDREASPMTASDPLSNTASVFVIAGHRYHITANKKGYLEGVGSFSSKETDSGKHIVKIYLNSDLLQNQIPVMVYFDNDEPDKRAYKRTTLKTYTDTYIPFVNRKETYKSEYGKPLSGEMKVRADVDIENFFENSVKGGYTDLHVFLGSLADELAKGAILELSVKGYASPRATSNYNKILSQRRIISVVNELQKFNDGVLLDYIYDEKLVLKDVSYGESTAPVSVSDALHDERNSIYSVEASKERRVEIVNIEYFEN